MDGSASHIETSPHGAAERACAAPAVAPVSALSRLRTGRRARFALMGVLGTIALVGLAWMDGGEEPLHPIVQEIERPAPIAADSSEGVQ
jgi:hypothetical protein